MRAEHGLLLADLRHLCQAEQLKAPAIGEGLGRPNHEFMQTAQFGDQPFARPQREVVRIAENHLRTGGPQHVDRHSFYRALRADRHERRHFDGPVRRDERASPGRTMGVAMQNVERETGHAIV